MTAFSLTEKNPYVNKILRERSRREKKLRQSALNWFSLVGLYPLRVGENTLGKSASYHISISELIDDAEAVISISQHSVALVQASQMFSINSLPASPRRMNVDTDENPDLLECGALAMMVIQRGTQYFLRVWDREAEALKRFHGLYYFPVDPAWRVVAQFDSFDPPRTTTIHNAVGGEATVNLPGCARFHIDGVDCTLLAEEDDEGLLFSFTDLTRQDATYPGGRYLLTPHPVNGKLVLDFNLARNWPRAYTPYATCPLPPPENHLKIRVEAGEKRYHD